MMGEEFRLSFFGLWESLFQDLSYLLVILLPSALE
jgi:hypothetical protein